jgi:hypothetical protein
MIVDSSKIPPRSELFFGRKDRRKLFRSLLVHSLDRLLVIFDSILVFPLLETHTTDGLYDDSDEATDHKEYQQDHNIVCTVHHSSSCSWYAASLSESSTNSPHRSPLEITGHQA